MDTEVSRLLNLAYFYLRFRPRTVDEMRKYLEKKAKKFSYTVSSIDNTIEKLISQKLLDDQSFIRWFMEIRRSSQKKSTALLKNELKLRGVPSDLVSSYFEEHIIDEYDAAVKALKSQWRRFQNNDLTAGRNGAQKRFQQSANYLQRKGFGYGIIKRAIADLEGKE